VVCQGIQQLDASKPYALRISGIPAGTTLSVEYAATSTGPSTSTGACSFANNLYTCDPRQDRGNGIRLLATPSGGIPAGVLAGLSKAPQEPPLSSYDENVAAKVRRAVPSYPALADGSGYDFHNLSGGRALVVLNSRAEPLRPIADVIDETDEIVVVVVDKRAYMQDVTVSISGCSRPPVEARVFGANEEGDAKGARAASENELGDALVKYVGKCVGAETGGPSVTIKTNVGALNETSSSVTIPVNPVYRLTVGIGLGADLTRTQSFGVATRPGATVPTVTVTNDRFGLSSLIFVGWYPLGRDFRKVPYFWQRMELFVAVDPRAVDESFVAGGGINLATGLDLLVGWRALTKRAELTPGAGLAPGSPFADAASNLPTTKVWSTGGLFLGVGVTTALLAKMH